MKSASPSSMSICQYHEISRPNLGATNDFVIISFSPVNENLEASFLALK